MEMLRFFSLITFLNRPLFLYFLKIIPGVAFRELCLHFKDNFPPYHIISTITKHLDLQLWATTDLE